jgi:hypothetical protein
MPDSLMIWGLWLTIGLSLLIIACAALMMRNLRGFRPDMRHRLAYILVGMSGPFGSSSALLMQLGRSTWPIADRHIFSWIEWILGILGLATAATAIRILARWQNQSHGQARAAWRQA